MSTKNQVIQIREIAKAAGVSSSTVSVVLNDRGDQLRIAKATQQRVRDIAEQMNYMPNISAKRLRSGVSEEAGYVIALFANLEVLQLNTGAALASRMIARFVLASRERNINAEFVLQPYYPGELSKLHSKLNGNMYSGAIITSASDDDLAFLIDNTFSMPIIVMNRNTNGKYMTVQINDYEAGMKCAEIFAQNGHRRVGVIGGKESSLATRLRTLGFQDGCRKFGMEMRPEWLINRNQCESPESHAIEQILTPKDGPTALVVMNDRALMNLLDTCRRKGLNSPADLEYIAYGTNDMYKYYTPSVSSFAALPEDLANGSLELMLMALKNHSLVVNKPVRVRFEFRDSCIPKDERIMDS